MPNLAIVTVSQPLLSAALTLVPPPAGDAAPSALVPLEWSLVAGQEGAPGSGPPPETLPPEDPSADGEQGNEIVVEGTYGPPKYDPIEQVNEASYKVSQAVDDVLVEPLSVAYRDGLPEPLRDGLGNVVRNLGEPSNALNFLLQGKVGKAFGALGRLAINSTLGLGGLIDIAAMPGIGIPYRKNGFANTLGYYGVGPGPYLFVPITGPTTVRDQIGVTLDQALLPFVFGNPFNRPAYAISYFAINGLDSRLRDDPELSAIKASDDPYAMRRETYLARRRREIAALKGEPIDEAPGDPQLDPAASPAPDPAPEAEAGVDPRTDPAAADEAAAPDKPPLSLVEQVQLTAKAAPATR